MHLPQNVRDLIEERAEDVGFTALKACAAEMSAAYREGRRVHLATPERVAAYLVTRMPATYAAARAVLGEVAEGLAGTRIESILDVGGGTGAASLAARELFHPARITIFEQEPAMAEAGLEILPEADIHRQDFTRIPSLPPHHLVIAAYALGEAGAIAVLARLWEAARVALVIIEPGTTAGFALIRDARSRLLAGGAHMIAPCPGEGACPVLAPDWCHFGARVERSSLHRRIKGAELNYEDEKFSYVALARETVPLAGARIIRRPRQQPGLITLETCVPSGVETVRALKRDRDTFRAARKAGWGDAWPKRVS